MATRPQASSARAVSVQAVLASMTDASVRDIRLVLDALLLARPSSAAWRPARHAAAAILAANPRSAVLIGLLVEAPASGVRAVASAAAARAGMSAATTQVMQDKAADTDAERQRVLERAAAVSGADLDAVRVELAPLRAGVSDAVRATCLRSLRRLIPATERSGTPCVASRAAVVGTAKADDAQSVWGEDLQLNWLVGSKAKPLWAGVGLDEPPPETARQSGSRTTASAAVSAPKVTRGPRTQRRRGRRPTAALPTQPTPPPASAAARAERRLQVVVAETATGQQRIAAFRPGVQHTLSVLVSPGDIGGLRVDQPIDETGLTFSPPSAGAPAIATLTVDVVFPGPGGTSVSQSGTLTLPRVGPSAPVDFDLWVPAGVTQWSASILLRSGHANMQSATLSGPVSDADQADAASGQTMSLVQNGDFVTDLSIGAGMPGPTMEASLSTQVGAAGEALLSAGGGTGTSIVSLPSRDALRAQIADAVRAALDKSAVVTTKKEQAEAEAAGRDMLRTLARIGDGMLKALPDSVRALGQLHYIQIVSSDDDLVPFEFIYDLGFPTETARLCRTWRQALETGTCTCLRRLSTTAAIPKGQKTLCPLGFWGMRLVIERQLATSGQTAGTSVSAGQLASDRDTLPAMNSVLFAASAKVDLDAAAGASRIRETMKALSAHPGVAITQAETWSAWRAAISKTGPGLLLSLPHNEAAEDGLPKLEIGDSDFIDVGSLDDDYVLRKRKSGATQTGPVVFLLGCNTAEDALPWQSAAAAFRRIGASVVVGTLAQALGRQSAPMAALLADLLFGDGTAQGPPITAQTLGDVIVAIRRRLVLEGMALGMTLVALGHAGWLLPPRPGPR